MLAALDPSNGFLPVSRVPDRLLLHAGHGDHRLRRPVPLTPPPAAAAPRLLSQYELHRILGPLERLRATAQAASESTGRADLPILAGDFTVERGSKTGGSAILRAPMANLKLKPGVITGNALKELFAYCKEAKARCRRST